jgi:hypothetical protein
MILSITSDEEDEMAVQDDMLNMLNSTRGQQALQKAMLAGLKSPDGQKALEQAARAVLREGFGNLDPPGEEFVHPSQQWLFTTVESLSIRLDEIWGGVFPEKEKVPD